MVLLPSASESFDYARDHRKRRRRTTESSSSSLRRLSFSFDSLSLARARARGDLKKPSRRPIFEKRETKAPKTQRRGSTRASLSLKKRHSRARSHHRVFSSPSFDADIRKIQNKSGEPETVENTRWRIMIRCDTFVSSKEKKREIQNSVHFFFHLSSI